MEGPCLLSPNVSVEKPSAQRLISSSIRNPTQIKRKGKQPGIKRKTLKKVLDHIPRPLKKRNKEHQNASDSGVDSYYNGIKTSRYVGGGGKLLRQTRSSRSGNNSGSTKVDPEKE